MPRMIRERYMMPKDIEERLFESNVMDDYCARPNYQQNDYIGWIMRAKRSETREKRIQQMLYELKKGGVYMKMKHKASEK